MDESTVKQWVNFTGEIFAHSRLLRKNFKEASARLDRFLASWGIKLSNEVLSALNAYIRQIQSGLIEVPQPAYLRVHDLRRASEILSLPSNTPIVYQRMEDSYFSELGWDQHRYLWDAEYETDYIAACSYHVGSDRNGNVTLCLNLMNSAADVNRLLASSRQPSAVNEEAIARLFPTYHDLLKNCVGRHVSEDDLEGVDNRTTAREMACIHNKVIITSNLAYSRAPTVGNLMEQFADLPGATPIMCQRNYDKQFDRAWPLYVLSREGHSAFYTDAYDWQFPVDQAGRKVACINSWC